MSLMEAPRAIRKALAQAAAELTAQTREHIVEEATKKLKTRRSMYIEGLSAHQESEHLWVINLDASVRWIDDGMQAHNMLDGLLKSPKAKRAKDGSMYIVVPFDLKKGKTQMTPAQSTLNATVKAEMGKMGIPYGKIETHKDGSPRLGVLHELDITKAPLKSFDGPGQGHGPIGEVRQGPTGIPFLQGVQVRQRKLIDKKGKEHVSREIVTFRVASSKHRDQGRWDHPGTAAAPLMEEGARWAKEQWESHIAPKIFDMIKAELP